VAERMTPAAVELALEIRREIEARQQDADDNVGYFSHI